MNLLKKRIQNLRGLYFSDISNCVVLYRCRCIHTLFFKNNIDVAFVDKDFYVVKVIKKLKPWKFAYCKISRYVIEQYSLSNKKFYKVGDFVKKEIKNESLSGL